MRLLRPIILCLPICLFVGCIEQTKLENSPAFDSGLSEYLEPADELVESTPKHLMSVDTNNGIVYQIDPKNGTAVEISSVSTEHQISTMDINDEGVAYVYDHATQQIGILDPCTGELNLLPEVNTEYVICGMSFDNNGALYALDSKEDLLLSFNLETGQATPIGSLEMDISACGLAYDAQSNRLFGATASTGEVFTIDKNTGATFNHSQTTVPFVSVGLEYEKETDSLITSTGAELFSVEHDDGTSTFVGSLRGDIDDLVYHPGCW